VIPLYHQSRRNHFEWSEDCSGDDHYHKEDAKADWGIVFPFRQSAVKRGEEEATELLEDEDDVCRVRYLGCKKTWSAVEDPRSASLCSSQKDPKGMYGCKIW
jgi:hypothetical protein